MGLVLRQLAHREEPGGGLGERLTPELFEAYATLLPVAPAPVAAR